MRATSATLIFRRLRIAGLLYAGVHVVSSLLVALMSTEALAQWLAPRAAIVAVSITFSLITYADKLERHAFWLSIALAIATAVYILVPLLRFGLGWGSDHGSLVLLIVCTGLLFPYTMKQMLALTGTILAMYLGAALYVFRPGDSGWLIEGVFYVTSASAIAVVGARLAYKLRAGEFLARQELGRERDNAEQLLLNILPASIVARLKKDQTAIADGFRDATVMFADLVGFTPLSAKMSPKALVEMLNDVFSRFDALTEKYGLEKIKTIGDAYMVAGGLPTPRSDHAIAVANMALEMREVAQQRHDSHGGSLAGAHRYQQWTGGGGRDRHQEVHLRLVGRHREHRRAHGNSRRAGGHPGHRANLRAAEAPIPPRAPRHHRGQGQGRHAHVPVGGQAPPFGLILLLVRRGHDTDTFASGHTSGIMMGCALPCPPLPWSLR